MRQTNPFIHEFNIDLKDGTTQQREKKPLSQGDAYADKILVRIHEAEKDIALDGVGVSAKVIRYDGMTVPLIGAVEGGAACIVLDDACYGVPGDIKVSVILSAGEMVQTVLSLMMNVETSETSIIVDNGTVSDLTEVLAVIAEARSAAAEAHKAAEDAKKAIAQMAGIEVTASGPLVNVKDAADFDAVQVVSEIKATADGVSAVNLTRTGKNLVSHLDYEVTRGHSETVITDDVIDVKTPSGYDYGRIDVSLKGGVTYTLVIDWEVYGRDASDTGTTTAGYRISPMQSSQVGVNVSSNETNRYVRTYTPSEDTDAVILWYPSYNSSVKASSRSRVMLLEGAYTAETAPAFEPGVKQTLTTSLPEAVHGGVLDWTSGLLTITHGADGAELAVPRTAQLAPQTLEMLKGENNVWSDTGDTSLTYNADIKMYIDAAIAEIAAAIINA